MVNSYTVGSYRLGYTLGVGSFGRVKLAVHERTNQKVAVKIINRAKMQMLDMHEKLTREISILQRLGRHPHVIRLYELIDTPTDLFVVMEYVSGGELFDYIVQKSRLQEHEARIFFQQMISGVDYCHQHLICHRDLKPENLLLSGDCTVKVGDFGLSNFMRDGEFLKTSCGSPNYAAPEVVSGKAYAGPEVDVWSCGVILYALLCGALPFDDENVPNLFKKIKHGNFSLPGHISDLARRLIVRMLFIDPAARISLKEVRRHAWTKGNNSSTIPAFASIQFKRVIDDDVITELTALGYEVDRITIEKYQVTGGVSLPPEVIAYNLLCDKKTAEEKSYSRGVTEEPHAFGRETRKRQSATAVFHADFSPFGVMSMMASRELFQDPNSKQSGEIFPVSHVKWRVGVESSLDSATTMTAILHTLKNLGYEWHIPSLHRIWCRIRKPDESHTEKIAQSDPRVILSIQLFRMCGKRAAVNIQVFDGSIAVGLKMSLFLLFAIYRTLTQVANRQALDGELKRKNTD